MEGFIDAVEMSRNIIFLILKKVIVMFNKIWYKLKFYLH